MRSRINLALQFALFPFLVLLLSQQAEAHPEGFSGLHVTITADRVRAAITLHTRDLGTWFPPGNFPDYVADVCREMERTVGEMIDARTDDQSLEIEQAHAFLLEVGLIEIDVDFPLPTNSETVDLLVWSKHLIMMPRGHQQLLFIEDRREMAEGAEFGTMRLEDVLTVERDAGTVRLPPIVSSSKAASVDSNQEVSIKPDEPKSEIAGIRSPKSAPASETASSKISFFLFGVEHILTGYDHLLFLIALLLSCTKFREATAIVTCFTLAHSITLALAAMEIVRFPSWIVESVIALSIVYVAIENLLVVPKLWPRAAITCGFGLVHGLGFASALRDIGLGTIPGGVVWPLLKFNLGVEAGQLCVAAVIFPLHMLARKKETFANVLVIAGSGIIAIVGSYWFVSRAFF
ncbi:MAG: HupE/UreJ family protein [Pirellulaceae bacterium]|nr:HupE/UreJ family protein [Pirellulaceae bacterium]